MLTHIFEFFDEKYWKKGMFLAGSHELWQKYKFPFMNRHCHDFNFLIFYYCFWLRHSCSSEIQPMRELLVQSGFEAAKFEPIIELLSLLRLRVLSSQLFWHRKSALDAPSSGRWRQQSPAEVYGALQLRVRRRIDARKWRVDNQRSWELRSLGLSGTLSLLSWQNHKSSLIG